MTASQTTQPVDGQRLARLCKDSVPGTDDGALIAGLQSAYQDVPTRLARVGQEWYRLGGVIDRQGNHVAHDLMEWSDRAYLECGQNLKTLVQHCREQRLIATRHRGVTLYVTVRSGAKAEEFIQIEIDRSQELADRYVADPEAMPHDLEELIDPLEPAAVNPYAVAPPRYIYRRKTDVALFMQELSLHRAEPHPAQRFMQDWNASSASQGDKAFCDIWTLRLYQHRGRHGEQVMNVEVVSAAAAWPAHLANVAGLKGKPLANLLAHFDADAGYPFAWFFHMVKGRGVSPHVGERVHQDLSKDYAYLPARDAAVLQRWIENPYCA